MAFGGLDGRVPEQELDLFEVTAGFAAGLGAGAAELMGTEPFDPDLLEDSVTTAQTAQSLRLSPTLPTSFTDGRSWPSLIPSAVC